MEAFKTIIWIINIFSSLAIIALVLMQHGKGAEAGASFGGSGSAQGVFGSGGNANFLSRMTGLAAMVFFASCLALGYVNSKASGKASDFSDVQQSQVSGSLNKASEQASAVAVEAASAASATASNSSGLATAAVAGTAAAAGKIALDKAQDKKAQDKTDKAKSKTDSNKNSKSNNPKEKDTKPANQKK